jgi:hypothetical protein
MVTIKMRRRKLLTGAISGRYGKEESHNGRW